MSALSLSPHVVVGLLSASLLVACGGGPEAPAAPAAPDATYTVRGEITRLPDAEKHEIWIRHESVPDFKDADGKVVGMESMTMPFDLASDASIDGLAVGDRVSFRLDMRWKGSPPAAVTALEKLPAGTRLEFDPTETPAPESAPAQTEPVPGAPTIPH